MEDSNPTFFDETLDEAPISTSDDTSPLAFRARPDKLSDFHGQDHIFRRYQFLTRSSFPGLILWGPPGSGKTTLAKILAKQSQKDLYTFSPVLGGVGELKKLISSAIEVKKSLNKDSIIFIDEIHRFNKSQQDALLPYVEAGAFTLIGATTENPRVSINRALLSRLHTIELKPLSPEALDKILDAAISRFKLRINNETKELIAQSAPGDARAALNFLEIIANENSNANRDHSLEEVRALIQENNKHYDKNQDRHYDVISAFIKSLRGSDPQAAILWLAVMIDGGEDPVFIARRLVIFASEDVGNADPSALTLAISALQSVQNIGMPEARIILAQATTYLASTVKSNRSYLAIDAALSYVQNAKMITVPNHLKNYPDKSQFHNYKYPHDFPDHFVKQQYAPEGMPNFYDPDEIGKEKNIKARLDMLWKK